MLGFLVGGFEQRRPISIRLLAPETPSTPPLSFMLWSTRRSLEGLIGFNSSAEHLTAYLAVWLPLSRRQRGCWASERDVWHIKPGLMQRMRGATGHCRYLTPCIDVFTAQATMQLPRPVWPNGPGESTLDVSADPGCFLSLFVPWLFYSHFLPNW